MKAKGFTLIEILIVVMILGIIAAVAFPKFSNASAAARASMMADDLRVIRTQVTVFKAQHNGVAPGYPNCNTANAPTEASFVDYMSQSSTAAGDLAAPRTAGFPYGPYLTEVPPNPVNGKSTVQIVGDGQPFPAAADDSHGWMFQPSTLTLRADSAGADEDGKPYFSY